MHTYLGLHLFNLRFLCLFMNTFYIAILYTNSIQFIFIYLAGNKKQHNLMKKENQYEYSYNLANFSQ